MSLQGTASQTVGPYLHIGLDWLNTDTIAGPDVSGEHYTVSGRVLDGDGKPVSDALVEIWQANTYGRYAHPEDRQDKPLEPGFKGFGRIPTDADGAFRFTTVKPGRVPGPGGTLQAPHLAVSIFMRGLLKRLVTRIYFPNEPVNGDDPVLKLVDRSRWGTLIARESAEGRNLLEWDVVLQGDNETVFFDL